MRNLLETLRCEFDAEENSFLIKLRCDFYWDKDAFERLTEAMRDYCYESQEKNLLERWIAEGFWFISHFVKDHSLHPSFPRPYAPEYYEKAYERLDDLAYWFFFGQSPYIEGKRFEPLEKSPDF